MSNALTDTSARGTHLRRHVGRLVLQRVVAPGALLYLFLVGSGLALAHPLAELAAGESKVNRDLADGRTPFWNAFTSVVSTLADTASIIGSMAVFAVLLRLLYGRWGESVTLMTAVILQSSIFLFTAAAVDRHRPDVPHLDTAPPTSSFPSGHTGAATALYVGIAVVVGWRLRHRWIRWALVLGLALLPLLVAMSRLYRGMHHVSDVAFGMLNGVLCVVIAVHAFRPGRSEEGLRLPVQRRRRSAG
jgi:membrane-associated phospholipid phosphatase